MKKLTSSLLFWVAEGLLLVALCAGFFFAFRTEAGAAWDGTIAASFASGEGTEENPYLVKTSAQMGYFMNQVAAGVTYSGMHIRLENNLDMTGATWSQTYPASFDGVFNGNGYTITADCPLFYQIGAEGVLKGLNYTTIHTTLDRALLCQYNYGVIDSCVGYGDVDYCEAPIICKNNYGTVTNCGAIGQLRAIAETAYAAMICENSGIVSNCFSALSITADGTGKYGEAFANPLVAKGAAPVNCYYDKTLYTDTTSHGLGLTTEEMKSAAFLSSLTGTSMVGTNWVTGSHGYPALTHCSSDYAYVDGYQGEDSIVYFAAYQTFTLKASNSSAKVYYTLDGSNPTTSGTAKYVTSGKTVTITGNAVLTIAPYYNGSYGSITKVDITFLPGEGTASNPYQLSNAKQLKTLALFPDQCFKLVSDITLTDADYAIGGIMIGGWHPVTEFTGVLDGAEHAIVNLQGSHGGLIDTNSGTVTALRLLDHKLYVYGSYGAIADDNDGTITYCYVRSGFTLDTLPGFATNPAAWVGGIAGYNSGTIAHCRNDGMTLFTGAASYSSLVSVGGIVGYATKSPTHCINNGTIFLMSYGHADWGCIGGITGRGSATNCLSSTAVETKQSFGYTYYIGSVAATMGSSGIVPAGGYCISKDIDFRPRYTHGSAAPEIYRTGYDLETSKVPADCPDLDFENNWMITSEGLVPQGVMNADGHCFVPNGEAILSTCTENGSAPVICLTCGKTEVQTLQLLDHAWSEPTCTEGSVCTDCGEAGEEALGHNYVDGYCETCGILQIIDSGAWGDNTTWTLDAFGKLTISGTGDMANAGSDRDYPWYDYRTQILSLVIEEGVTTVGNYAFMSSSNLSAVELPDGLTRIGDCAFMGRPISNIEIPQSVTTIAFAAFSGCDKLETLVIPASVTQIVDQAFNCCSALESIVVPVSVQRFPTGIFAGCTSLREIHFTGTKAQWVAIEKDSTWDAETGDYTVYYAPCDPADHVWVDATCTEPKICSVCGTTEGEPVHGWVGATCTEPKTCALCGETEGDPLGHSHVGNSIACIRCGLNRSDCGVCGEDVRWVLDTNGLLTIYGTGEMENFSQGGAPWYTYRTTTTAAEILDGVTTIGDAAFYAFYKLERIAMADSIVSIGYYAFKDCRVLDDVVLPADLNRIGYYAFENCTSLTSIVIPDGVTSIGSNAFNGCTSLQSAVLPKNITSIKDWLFRGCSSLTGIVIPEGVTEIGHSAFDGCSSMEYAVLPEGIITIASAAFRDCGKLQSFEIPSTVCSIGEWAFEGCSSLQSIVIPEGVTEIGAATFQGCSSLRSVEIPEGVMSIGISAFDGCGSLENIVIPSSVISIGSGAFSDCSSLVSIVIHGDVTSIGEYTFSGCSSLQSIVLPEGVTSIGYSAFRGCSSLQSIVILKGVTSIGDAAFRGCSSLRSVEIPEGVMSIGISAFDGCGSLENIVIPSSVISIGSGAFSDCSSLVSIVIHGDVTSIGEYTFSGCSSLQSIVLPEGVTSIGYSAFDGCSSLQSIVIPEGVTSISDFAFDGCSSLQSVVIPDGVTSIGDDAFQCCENLQSIVIPSSVTSIGSSAFNNCYELWHVFYGGTEEEWNAVVIDDGNYWLTDATRHYECTGEETLDLENRICSVCASICEHAWIDATCDAPQTCSLCGTTEGDPVHQWLDATCDEPQTCELCGVTEGDPMGHIWNLSVEKLPTAEKEGKCVVRCLRCELKEKFVLPVLNGSDYTYEVRRAASATADGYGCYTWTLDGYGSLRFYEVIRHDVADDATQVVLDSTTVVVGNTIRLEMVLKNNPGLMGMKMSLAYDTSALTLVRVFGCELPMDMDVGKQLMWTANGENTENGVLCVLEFQIAENAQPGEYPITMTLQQALNESFQAVEVHTVSGVVKVIDVVYGDVNDDGLVDLIDVLMLRKYLVSVDPDTGETSMEVGAGADVNGDGEIDLIDVLMLRKYLVSVDPDTGEPGMTLGPQ